MKLFAGVVGWTVGIVLLVLVLSGGIWAFTVATAELRGRGDAHIQLNSAPYRIAAYDHFFELCVSVQNAEAMIDAQSQLLSSATTEQERQLARTNIAANESARAAGINKYNADATKNYTLGQFRDSDLPYQLSTAPYVVGGMKTQCAYS